MARTTAKTISTTTAKIIMLVILPVAVILISLGACLWILQDLPDPRSLTTKLNDPSIRFVDRAGKLLYESLPAEGGRHQVLSLDEIPTYFQHATLATEDRNFYHHPGVDAAGILRALWINLRGGETLAGGSTITQQVARTLLLDPDERFERSLRRKLRESWLAWRLARHFTKDEILAFYLNQTYYGGLAYGVEAAAQTFFGKSASDLDLAECALLAGLPQAPALYNPLIDFEAAKDRQAVVLGLMVGEGFITTQDGDLAHREPLIFESVPYPMEAPHFVLWVRAMLEDLLAPEDFARGLTVRTSLDLDWQHHAERAVTEQLDSLRSRRGGLGHNVNNAALVALDPLSGEILAMVGSPDYFDGHFGGAINMALTPRQPGSALKPLVYAEAFDPTRANPWTAATMILDVRQTFMTVDNEPYNPENYDNLEHGPVLARQALASSLNIPSVAALDAIGIEALVGLAADLGITSLDNPVRYDLSIALGGGEVSLLELAAAYAAFANGGDRLEPISILEITDAQGNFLFESETQFPIQVLDARVAWLISDILSDNDARILGFGEHSSLNIGRPAAVKTGTTSNFHDNWTVGYTPELVTGVWVGNTSHEPMLGVTGLTGAAPIWHHFMRATQSDLPELNFDRPDGLVEMEICALSGLLPTRACPYRHLEWFIEGTQPEEKDSMYRQVEIDVETHSLADENTPQFQRKTVVVLDLPPEAHTWARTQGLPLLTDLSTGDHDQTDNVDLQIISPAPNSIYYLSPNLPAQNLHLQAVGPAGMEWVNIWLDGEIIASFESPPYEAWWALKEGEHLVWVEALTTAGDILESSPGKFEVIMER